MFLAFPEAGTLRLSSRSGPVSGNGNPFRPALMVVIIQAVHHITVHHQLGLRRFKQISEQTSPVFLKTSAAGIAAGFRLSAFHHDSALTAAFFRIMNACGYGTVQVCHRIFLLFCLRVRRPAAVHHVLGRILRFSLQR